MTASKDALEGVQQNEDFEHAATHGTYLDKEEASHLSEEHRQYLIQRHGTLDIDPLPTMSDADPYNWPTHKKVLNLAFVAFHACMCAFPASAIIPAYETIAEDLGSFFISPPNAIGSAVVVESFFKRERARYMGVWTVMLTIGIPLAPLIFGFVTTYAGYRWIYWILAIINGVQLVLYGLFGPETRFIRHGQYFKFRRIDTTPITAIAFVSPLRLAKCPCIMIPTVAYAMVFLFASVLTSVEIPQLFAEKFHFNAQQLGLQFLGLIIGSIVGEQISGYSSDLWMRARAKRIAPRRPAPEFRLWLSYFGILLTICGIVVFLVRIEQAPEGQWNVTPIIGAGIAAAGNQIVTTTLIMYAVDCYPDEAGSIGVFITFVRHVWGFIGPFWFPDMFATVGIANSAGVVVALIIGVSLFPVIFTHWRGHKMRGEMSGRM
ncbi:hypothetical protein SNOG_13804 [Parastagonospora nodorum SN15]|uniref:Major facilitator superfamily (MFS) profile domain-containing protein n=1 Tax=Phaeosphaeria nodorum (strain SN15 / ATCC MYA-4574 / FGSC 10173) TaxID=321614 RepID=Q0U360_PHANO|nr:hypothetical protein SNOG_13804 [Parastagonospora nodorum SN15]EAT78828.2 hypothetical protein SNOG_13804 [Parastagonospora nodorum SN15]